MNDNLKDKLKSPGQKFNTADGNEYLFSFLEKTNELKSLRCMIINLVKLKKPNFFD